MKIKKLASTVLIGVMLISFNSMCFANEQNFDVNSNKTSNINYYSNEKIKEIAEDSNGKSRTKRSVDSFISKHPIKYISDYQTKEREAFELGEVSFDTRGEKNSSSITLSYTESQNVEWTISGDAESDVNFRLIEAKISAGISRKSSTSSAIGASITKTIKGGKTGCMKIYAQGVKTGGAIEYKYTDVSGHSGTFKKHIRATLPLTRYDKFSVHFGRLIYD